MQLGCAFGERILTSALRNCCYCCRDAANIGVRPQQQFDLARQNYTTVVSLYEQQLKQTPPCVRNSTWFKGINSSIAGLLKPANDNSTAGALGCGMTIWSSKMHSEC